MKPSIRQPKDYGHIPIVNDVSHPDTGGIDPIRIESGPVIIDGIVLFAEILRCPKCEILFAVPFDVNNSVDRDDEDAAILCPGCTTAFPV